MVPGRLIPLLVIAFLVSFYFCPSEIGLLPCIIALVSGLALGAAGRRGTARAVLILGALSAGTLFPGSPARGPVPGNEPVSQARGGIWDCRVDATTSSGALLISGGQRFWAGSRALASEVRRGDSVTVLAWESGGFMDVSLFHPRPSGSLHDRIRRYLSNTWSRRIRSRETSAIVSTLVAGERGGVPGYVRETFEKSGTTHLLAVSGLHVGIIAAAFLLLSRVFRMGRWSSLILTMTAVAAYVLLTGARASTVRAATMAFMVLLALRTTGRTPDLLFIWSAAVLLVLLLTGGGVLNDVGAQMSFGAVLSLILIGRRFGGRLSGVRSILFAGLIVTVSLAPLVSSVYGGVSPAAPAATLVSLPFMITLMVIGPLVLLPEPLSGIAALAAEWTTYVWLRLLDLIQVPSISVDDSVLGGWAALVIGLWVLSKRGGILRRFI